MLTLTRKHGERIIIGTDIEIEVLGVTKGRVKLGIQAPKSLPIHRAELIEKIAQENMSAVTKSVEQELEDFAICFEKGLFGLEAHNQFAVCEVGEDTRVKALVSCSDSHVQLLIMEVFDIVSDYPAELVRESSGIRDEEVAIVVVLNLPADGSAPTVNLAAPIIMSVSERKGMQVVLDRAEFGVRHPLNFAGESQSQEAAR